MSSKYLGKTFDLHTGGIDNLFPHHENEIAQSELLLNKKFVNFWLHCDHLLVDGNQDGKIKEQFLHAQGYYKKKVTTLWRCVMYM